VDWRLSESDIGAPPARRGFSPLDKAVQLTGSGWSEGIQRLAVWLSGQMSYEQVTEVLSQVGQIAISPSSLWRQVTRWGERLLAEEDAACARANAIPQRGESQRGEGGQQERMGVSVDGWMVNIRQEGWKEVKTATVFRVAPGEKAEARTGETMEVGRAVECSYVAHLGGPEGLGEKLWAEGVRRQVPAAREKVWVSDGAAWIWGLCQDYWPEAVQIVDWYHAKTHLHRAGELLLGEGTARSKSWVERQAGELYRGQVWRITEELESEAERLPGEQGEALRREAGYFRRNQRRMQYLEYREEGWPIGSGAMESGCKQFAQRLKGPGMRWSRRGAERMLALRATILSGRFDQIWCTLQNSPDS